MDQYRKSGLLLAFGLFTCSVPVAAQNAALPAAQGCATAGPMTICPPPPPTKMSEAEKRAMVQAVVDDEVKLLNRMGALSKSKDCAGARDAARLRGRHDLAGVVKTMCKP
jgi:hypothetical protein